MNGHVERLVEALLVEQLFDVDSVQQWAQAVQQGVRAPVVRAQVSTLGGKERVTLMILIVWDPKETWANGIMENARYARFSLYRDGKLEMFSGGAGNVDGQFKRAKTFRRTVVKSLDDLLTKLNKYVAEAWT
jgi:hypothetical protein